MEQKNIEIPSDSLELKALLKSPPRYHIQLGPLFSNEYFLLPGSGKNWFGGSIEIGGTVIRVRKTYELGLSGYGKWNAEHPFQSLVSNETKYLAYGYRLYFQNLERYVNGFGFRFNLGMDHVRDPSPWPELYQPVWRTVPNFSLTCLAQWSSGVYLFLDLGGIIYIPVTLGIGIDL